MGHGLLFKVRGQQIKTFPKLGTDNFWGSRSSLKQLIGVQK